MAAEKWVFGVSSLVAASLTGYKAYDDYTKATAADIAAMGARDKALHSQGEAASALMRAGNESEMAATSYRRAALVFGIGSLISTSLAIYTLWPRKKR